MDSECFHPKEIFHELYSIDFWIQLNSLIVVQCTGIFAQTVLINFILGLTLVSFAGLAFVVFVYYLRIQFMFCCGAGADGLWCAGGEVRLFSQRIGLRTLMKLIIIFYPFKSCSLFIHVCNLSVCGSMAYGYGTYRTFFCDFFYLQFSFLIFLLLVWVVKQSLIRMVLS